MEKLEAGRLGRTTELTLAFGLLGVLLLFVVPLPSWVLDLGLALSIARVLTEGCC